MNRWHDSADEVIKESNKRGHAWRLFVGLSPWLTLIAWMLASYASPAALPATVPPSSTALVSPSPTPQAGTPVYTYRVIKSYPHDREAFTQGLGRRIGSPGYHHRPDR
ncbi:MAG: glutaminyl-peptide cyclotransferase [Nitrospirae bacterium]|nr:glutaminyl-peptide cyclotransferase [Nitrospirota bacterium]